MKVSNLTIGTGWELAVLSINLSIYSGRLLANGYAEHSASTITDRFTAQQYFPTSHRTLSACLTTYSPSSAASFMAQLFIFLGQQRDIITSHFTLAILAIALLLTTRAHSCR